MTDLVGQTIGQYRIVELIGTGGMASVYKAHQRALDRFVAIKVLPAQHTLSPGFKDRFLREAKAIAQLSHPNILPIYDVGLEGDLSYFVMKYVPGQTLAHAMGLPMSLPIATRFIEQASSALDHSHERGILHRDIKPGNMLLEGEWLLLADFGLAKIVEGSVTLTQTGVILGTPTYMSPEQCAGKSVDRLTDIYSLGVVLYEMLTGRPPYQGKTPMEVIVKHLTDDVPHPRDLNPAIPDAAQEVLLRALAKKPDERFHSAGELAQSLRRALAVPSDRTTIAMTEVNRRRDDSNHGVSATEAAHPTVEVEANPGPSPRAGYVNSRTQPRIPLDPIIAEAVGVGKTKDEAIRAARVQLQIRENEDCQIAVVKKRSLWGFGEWAVRIVVPVRATAAQQRAQKIAEERAAADEFLAALADPSIEATLRGFHGGPESLEWMIGYSFLYPSSVEVPGRDLFDVLSRSSDLMEPFNQLLAPAARLRGITDPLLQERILDSVRHLVTIDDRWHCLAILVHLTWDMAQELAEHYTSEHNHLHAAETYLALERPVDAARSFERGGRLNEAWICYECAEEYGEALRVLLEVGVSGFYDNWDITEKHPFHGRPSAWWSLGARKQAYELKASELEQYKVLCENTTIGSTSSDSADKRSRSSAGDRVKVKRHPKGGRQE